MYLSISCNFLLFWHESDLSIKQPQADQMIIIVQTMFPVPISLAHKPLDRAEQVHELKQEEPLMQ